MTSILIHFYSYDFILYPGLLLGVLTVFYAWRTQFRDPGILDPYLPYGAISTQLLFQASDDEEAGHMEVRMKISIFLSLISFHK
jgi:hypothetical protein